MQWWVSVAVTCAAESTCGARGERRRARGGHSPPVLDRCHRPASNTAHSSMHTTTIHACPLAALCFCLVRRCVVGEENVGPGFAARKRRLPSGSASGRGAPADRGDTSTARGARCMGDAGEGGGGSGSGRKIAPNTNWSPKKFCRVRPKRACVGRSERQAAAPTLGLDRYRPLLSVWLVAGRLSLLLPAPSRAKEQSIFFQFCAHERTSRVRLAGPSVRGERVIG